MYMINKIKQKIQNSISLLRIGLETCFNLVARGILTCSFQKSTLKPPKLLENSKQCHFYDHQG